MVAPASRGGGGEQMKASTWNTQCGAGHAGRAPRKFDFTNIYMWEINSPAKGKARKKVKEGL